MSFFSKAFIINGMENYNFDIQEELKKLPAKPGVYIMHDERDHNHLCRKGDQPEKPGASVFSNQPE